MIHLLAVGYNPFTGASPSLGPFQSVLSSKLTMFISVVWAAGFIYSAYHLLIGVTRLANAVREDVPNTAIAARREVGFAAAAAVGLSIIALIWGVMVG